ncbi:outer membrane beta-barrel protein [Chitinophagaceae bacterium LB-8]|uniref:Outer membrane beta-barrel protein n=1 Tax=Paraflavisolibacter caeni TaxID=2982496 RepID=A0A9X2Y2R0_9BACT|nr:outer membrane beta-barrel protein [Paraflavisolibacter caeni]MCU7552903.1 outer membrane beta-barrel protein [Paraflavisolibacter caeni]
MIQKIKFLFDKKKLLFLFAFIGLFNFAFAQQESQLRGKVVDTLGKAPLSNAVISLLHKKDSTLSNYTRSGKDGSFILPHIGKGQYIVMITFPKFADYVEVVNVQEQAVDMGSIALTQKATLLKEVVIQSGRAIRIKGDTTEFTADSFHVKDGATVEDLLKEFPGFQVDSKGQITAHGQRVQKVLVDGEEFFGDDPTMATQNIAARAVDKVQVFDTKTDQQNLTGLGGNSQSKTVNIKLKENSKKGAFGKINAGSDFQKYHDGKALYNRFVGKKKVSVYGTKSTVSTGSLNWEDRQKLGVENDMEYDEVGGYYISYGGGDFEDWSLRGLPDSYSAGALFSNKWNEDKHGVNGSYRYNRLSTINESSTLTQTILSSGLLYSDRRVKTNGLNQQHAINGKYEWKLDSLASFKFTTAGIYKTTQGYNNTKSFTQNENHLFLNENDQTTESETENKQLDNQLTYKQLFKKKDRQLLTTLRFGLVEDDNNGTLYSTFKKYDAAGNFLADSITDQQKLFTGSSQTIGTRITFSEPLTPKLNLVVNYGYNNNNSASNRASYNDAGNSKYEILDSLYSNNFNLDVSSHSAMGVLRYVGKKTRFAFGSGLSALQLNLDDQYKDKKTTYNFLNITPQANYSYQLKQQKYFSVNYRGTTRQPSMNQLQPIRDNNDQTNVFVGNPNLKVGFNHWISAGYSNYKILTGQNLYLGVNYGFTQNDISNASIIDASGKRTYTPINVNGNNNWVIYGNWNIGQGEKKLRHGVNLSANGGRNINFINNEKGINNYSSFYAAYNLGYDVKDKFNFNIRPNVRYNTSRSSLRKVDNNFFSYGASFYGYVMLPGKIEISSDVNADLRQKIGAFDRNTNIIQWNGNISKKVLKDKSGKIIIVANDILNQNKGYNQSINSNFVTDERYLRVSRYFLLKFEWSFNKMPTGK